VNEQATARKSDPTLGQYLSEIGRYRLLTRDEETHLAREIERRNVARDKLQNRTDLSADETQELARVVARGDEAWNTFVRANLRLVVSIARKHQSPAVPLLDVIQEGNLGLMHAVDRFDWRMGFKFSTYATWWIREAILRVTRDQRRPIQLPAHIHREIGRIHASGTRLEVALGRPATNAEVGNDLGVSAERVTELLAHTVTPLSLSEPRGEGSATLADLLVDEAAAAPFDVVSTETVRAVITPVLAELTDRERKVIELRFGLDCGEPRSLAEVAKHFPLTRQRIRQIEQKAIAQMREAIPAESGARDLLDA
jgi:RNA polymerase sigma factor (sigma-70 family)